MRDDEGSQVCGRRPESSYVELAVEVFSVLADVTRVQIILALREREELSVNQLAEVVDRPATAVSQHLAKLRMVRMVATRRQGNQVFYRLVDEHARQLVGDAIFAAEHATSSSPHHHREPAHPRSVARTTP